MTRLPLSPLLRSASAPLVHAQRGLAHVYWWLAHHAQPSGGGYEDPGEPGETRPPASVRLHRNADGDPRR